MAVQSHTTEGSLHHAGGGAVLDPAGGGRGTGGTPSTPSTPDHQPVSRRGWGRALPLEPRKTLPRRVRGSRRPGEKEGAGWDGREASAAAAPPAAAFLS